MSPKYRIFLSSTYKDLIAERDQVTKAILEMGHIPVGMEMFSAGDEEQWDIIARAIDQSDYYVVLVAHRYGSMVDGVSYTEKEYDYAVEQSVPVLGFVIDESASWPANRMDTDANKKTALSAFKKKIKKKPAAFWESAADLYGKCPIALMKQMTRMPRPGWVRATNVAGPEVATELARLAKENADLREKIDQRADYLGMSYDEMSAVITEGGMEFLERVYESGGHLNPLSRDEDSVLELARLGLITKKSMGLSVLSEVGRRFMLQRTFK